MKYICHAEPEGILYSNVEVKHLNFMNITKPMAIKESGNTLILDFFTTVNISPKDYYDNLTK